MKLLLFGTFLLFAFAVESMASVSITTTDLPNGAVKKTYSAVINASGGCAPYKWALVSGSLPTGVKATPSSNTASLSISGLPTAAATFSFKISVTGCGGHVSDESYKVTIESGTGHVVDLSWEASKSDDLAGYNVYRELSGTTWEKINAAVVAAPLYDDVTVINGDTYYYAVTAVNIRGEESPKTPAVKVVVP
jgi:hypothetical protein